jgi:hypothetical protein
MSYVLRLGLEEEKQVSVFLRLLVIGKEAFLQLGGFVEVVRDFVLLQAQSIRGPAGYRVWSRVPLPRPYGSG